MDGEIENTARSGYMSYPNSDYEALDTSRSTVLSSAARDQSQILPVRHPYPAIFSPSTPAKPNRAPSVIELREQLERQNSDKSSCSVQTPVVFNESALSNHNEVNYSSDSPIVQSNRARLIAEQEELRLQMQDLSRVLAPGPTMEETFHANLNSTPAMQSNHFQGAFISSTPTPMLDMTKGGIGRADDDVLPLSSPAIRGGTTRPLSARPDFSSQPTTRSLPTPHPIGPVASPPTEFDYGIPGRQGRGHGNQQRQVLYAQQSTTWDMNNRIPAEITYAPPDETLDLANALEEERRRSAELRNLLRQALMANSAKSRLVSRLFALIDDITPKARTSTFESEQVTTHNFQNAVKIELENASLSQIPQFDSLDAILPPHLLRAPKVFIRKRHEGYQSQLEGHNNDCPSSRISQHTQPSGKSTAYLPHAQTLKIASVGNAKAQNVLSNTEVNGDIENGKNIDSASIPIRSISLRDLIPKRGALLRLHSEENSKLMRPPLSTKAELPLQTLHTNEGNRVNPHPSSQRFGQKILTDTPSQVDQNSPLSQKHFAIVNHMNRDIEGIANADYESFLEKFYTFRNDSIAAASDVEQLKEMTDKLHLRMAGAASEDSAPRKSQLETDDTTSVNVSITTELQSDVKHLTSDERLSAES